MDVEELDEFIYEFHERVLGLTPERDEPHEWSERPEWDWSGQQLKSVNDRIMNVSVPLNFNILKLEQI